MQIIFCIPCKRQEKKTAGLFKCSKIPPFLLWFFRVRESSWHSQSFSVSSQPTGYVNDIHRRYLQGLIPHTFSIWIVYLADYTVYTAQQQSASEVQNLWVRNNMQTSKKRLQTKILLKAVKIYLEFSTKRNQVKN